MSEQDSDVSVDVYRDDDGDYTIVDDDGGIFVANGNPNHHQHGLFQYAGSMGNPLADWDVDNFGEKIPWDDVPDNVQSSITERVINVD